MQEAWTALIVDEVQLGQQRSEESECAVLVKHKWNALIGRCSKRETRSYAKCKGVCEGYGKRNSRGGVKDINTPDIQSPWSKGRTGYGTLKATNILILWRVWR